MPNKLEVQVIGDTKQYEAAMKRAQKASGGFEKGLQKASRGALVALGALGVGAAFSVRAASNLEEQINKTSVVFGKAAPAIQAWGETTAASLGISNRAALEAAGTFGNMLVPMGLARPKAAAMSKAMVELAADMASFNNASPEDVLEALRSGLSGETEPLRKFGVFLNEARIKQEALNLGLVKGKEKLTAADKAMATYSIILKDTGDAQGDFARTSDSVANSQRVLRAQVEDTAAQLGAALLPAAKSVLNVLVDMVEFTQDNADAAKILTGVVGGLSAGIVLANASLSIYNSGILKATKATKGLRLAMAVTPWGAAIAAAGFLAEALLSQKDDTNAAEDAQRDLTTALLEYHAAVKAGKEARLNLESANLRLERSEINVKQAVNDRRRVEKDATSTLLERREADLRVAEAQNERRRAEMDVTDAAAAGRAEQIKQNNSTQALIGSFGRLTAQYQNMTTKQRTSNKEGLGTVGVLRKVTTTAGDARANANKYADALRRMADSARANNPKLARTADLAADLADAWGRVVSLPAARQFVATFRIRTIIEEHQQTTPNHPGTRPSGGGGGGGRNTSTSTQSTGSRGRYTILADQEFVDHLRATDQNYRRTNGGRGIFAT